MENNLYIPKDGYMETFLVYETDENVWFDDFSIMSSGSPIVQETHYDPWGLELTGLGFQASGMKVNKYLYNGKELISDLNLGLYDYGAHFYDPAIGRFPTVDQKTETYNSWSPYLYGANNLARYEDTNGEGPGDRILGFLVAVVENTFGGLTPVRQMGARYVSQGGAADYNIGQDVGDIYSISMGAAMVDGGSAAAIGGAAATVATVGAASPVSVPVAATGAVVAAEGFVMSLSGANSLLNQKERVNAEGTNSQDTGQVRGKNNRTRDDNATGNHSVINENGHTTYKVNNNNPNKNSQGVGFETQKRVDYKGNAHVDKATGQKIESPHVQENGTVRPATNSDLSQKTSKLTMNTLIWIQEWYHQQCDGEWEHEYGVSITTIDNPGWDIRIDLIGDDFEGVSIPYKLVEKSSSDWYGIKVENQVFEAFGDPSKLNFLLEKFREFIVDRKKM